MYGPFKLNDHLLVELADLQCYVGQLVFQNAGCTRFELQNVRNCSTQQPFQSVQIFRSNNIRSMRLLPSEVSLQPATEAASSSSSSSDSSDESAESPATSPVQAEAAVSPAESAEAAATTSTTSNATTVLSVEELQRLQTACHSPSYYPHADRNFYATIEELRSQDTVAISVGYAYAAAHSTVGLVAAVTACDGRVHLFDVVTMGGRLPDALRSLLAASRPLKLVHDFTLAAYILQNVYNCRLAGAFDTRMAHAAIGGRSGLVGLGQLVEAYLRVPAQTVDAVAGDGQQQQQPTLTMRLADWIGRPLTAERRQLAAQQVAYLQRLYSVLLHERMLAAFLRSCSRFVHTYSDEYDEIDVACHVSCREQVDARQVEGDDEEEKGSAWMAVGVREADVPRLERLEQLEI